MSNKPDNSADWRAGVPFETGSVIRRGGLFVGFFIALFVGWSVLFPLAGAVVVFGSIAASGDNKLLQHPSGGVVRAIYASDGQPVKKGDIIFSIDPALSQAERTRLRARRTILLAQKERLEASGSGEVIVVAGPIVPGGLFLRGRVGLDEDFVLAPLLTDTRSQERIFAEQRSEFNAARARYDSELLSAHHQVESLMQDRAGAQVRRDGMAKLLTSNRAELKRMRPLASQGYVAQRDVWVLERSVGEQQTQFERLGAELAGLAEKVAEAEQRLAQIVAGQQESVSQELSEVLTRLAETSDQLRAAEVAVEAADIRAPVDGIVVNMVAKTVGGVVSGFATLGEIVPADAVLIAKGRVRPQDVAQVWVGQSGEVVITAFNARKARPIRAEVIYISADSLLDEKTGEVYFEVHLRPNETPGAANGLADIAPGMQAEMFLSGPSRTFLAYAMTPLRDSFRKAFLER